MTRLKLLSMAAVTAMLLCLWTAPTSVADTFGATLDAAAATAARRS